MFTSSRSSIKVCLPALFTVVYFMGFISVRLPLPVTLRAVFPRGIATCTFRSRAGVIAPSTVTS